MELRFSMSYRNNGGNCMKLTKRYPFGLITAFVRDMYLLEKMLVPVFNERLASLEVQYLDLVDVRKWSRIWVQFRHCPSATLGPPGSNIEMSPCTSERPWHVDYTTLSRTISFLLHTVEENFPLVGRGNFP